MNIKRFIIIYLFVFLTISSEAQEIKDNKHAVFAKGKVAENGIKIRWAPNTPMLWLKANKYGYKVEKYLVVKDGQLLPKKQRLSIQKNVFKPRPYDDWEALVNKSDYASVAAQAIYGESFQLSNNHSGDISEIVNKAKEQDMRFAFALMACDYSLKTAQYSGLYMFDKQVKKGEKYLYRVYVNMPDETMNADTALVYMGLEDAVQLPKPTELTVQFGNKTTFLSWNYLLFRGIYTAYQVERSEDGVNFQKISNIPISNPSKDKPTYAQRFMFKSDTIPQNYKTYYYRVRGLDPFGDIGPPSEVVKGQGIETNTAVPQISTSQIIKNEKVIIQWKFDSKDERLIRGFFIEKAKSAHGKYQTDHTEILKNTQRKYEAKLAGGVTYYRVTAVDIQGRKVNSFPKLIQIPDSIPPVAPTLLKGNIDSTGKVTLNWKKPKDKDILGYRIYRSNFDNVEYSQVTISPVKDTIFVDTISLKNLTKEIYYKVVTVDEYYNSSKFSEKVKLLKPDKNPPIPPVFQSVQANESSIVLSWIVSSSEDTKFHLLYRLEKGKQDWVLIKKIPVDTTQTYDRSLIQTYQDESAVNGVAYQYTVIAVDRGNLESEPARPVNSQRVDLGFREGFKKLKYKSVPNNKSILFTWQKPKNKIEKYLVYRAKDEEKMTLYKSLKAELNSWQDKQISLGHKYFYRLQIVYKDGGKSSFTKNIEIKF